VQSCENENPVGQTQGHPLGAHSTSHLERSGQGLHENRRHSSERLVKAQHYLVYTLVALVALDILLNMKKKVHNAMYLGIEL